MINLLLDSGRLEEFEVLLKVYNVPNFIVKTLLITPKEIASHEKIKDYEKIFTLDVIETIIQAVAEKKINESNVKYVFEETAKGKDIKGALKIEKHDSADVEQEIARIVKEKPGLTIGAYMGLVMQKFKGKISGKEVSEILGKLIK